VRIAFLGLLLPACGYTWGAAATQPRTQAGLPARVAVEPFDVGPGVFYRGLETRLTRLVADELRARTPGAPARRADADWLLSGVIVQAEQRIYSEDRSDAVRESSFVVTVRVTLRNRADGREISTYPVSERESFSPRAGRIATLEQATEQALRDVAEGVVYELERVKPKETS